MHIAAKFGRNAKFWFSELLACRQSQIAKLARFCTIKLEFQVGMWFILEKFSDKRRPGDIRPPPAFHFLQVTDTN